MTATLLFQSLSLNWHFLVFYLFELPLIALITAKAIHFIKSTTAPAGWQLTTWQHYLLPHRAGLDCIFSVCDAHIALVLHFASMGQIDQPL